jgi:hypothetical protein
MGWGWGCFQFLWIWGALISRFLWICGWLAFVRRWVELAGWDAAWTVAWLCPRDARVRALAAGAETAARETMAAKVGIARLAFMGTASLGARSWWGRAVDPDQAAIGCRGLNRAVCLYLRSGLSRASVTLHFAACERCGRRVGE